MREEMLVNWYDPTSTILLTGGYGFIGSHMLLELCALHPGRVVNVDAKTYAARPPLYRERPHNLINEEADIRDQLVVKRIMDKYKPDHVIHLAAESHVCRSIRGPKDFVTTNINGTWNLLEEFRMLWQDDPSIHRFLHFSTDEVFGEILKGKFNEQSQIKPRSPYAASKAASDLLAISYAETYSLNVSVVNCSNNFGPNQHEEKLVAKTISRILSGQEVQVYQDGSQVRDWIYVKDCARAAIEVFFKGEVKERYCIGGEQELTNLEMIHTLYRIISNTYSFEGIPPLRLKKIDARPTDDQRYALNCSKIKKLGWKPPSQEDFAKALMTTVLWYAQRVGARPGVAIHGTES